MLRVPAASRICTLLVLAIGAAACATTSSSPTTHHPSPFPNPSSPSSIRPESASAPAPFETTALIRTALSLEGVPYRWGGDQPDTGFDCSGFVQYVLAQHQIAAPRTAADQFRLGKKVDLNQIRAGDLVFFSTVAPGASHVGLALGGDEFVHAPATNGVVRVERVTSTYWRERYVGARRVF
jgi:cell wall-associated NlpC family hydrolase